MIKNVFKASMRKRKLFFLALFAIILTASFSIGRGGLKLQLVSFGAENNKMVSPEPLSGRVLGINQWFPKSDEDPEANPPEITSRAAIFLDTKTGEVFYAKNTHQRLPIASLTKVMTVAVVLEHHNLDDNFTISKIAAGMEPDKMQLLEGEKLSLKELLEGVFLISANDAAQTLAENSASSPAAFVKMMNEKAKQIGMEDSFFANPTGLDEDQNNTYSSAYDLVLLARYVIRNYPFLIDISSQQHILIPQTSTHQDYDLYNGINLLATYPGVVGFKTGYTPEAGLTLITLARKDGHEVLGVLLGAENRREDAKELLDYSFKKLSAQF